MKLIRAEFNNFRLLRNLHLDFSTDTEKRLTVIRAENESGKTTILSALQWCLYGDSALPGGGRSGYRLHPIDWNRQEGDRVPISVSVDFETTTSRRTQSGAYVQNTQIFRFIRTSFDSLNGDAWEPGPTSVALYEQTPAGSKPIDSPDALIGDMLPDELREIFFTDGDRALSFIEAEVSQTTKQTRVRKAIQTLLGLEIIDDAKNRVKRSSSDINKQARQELGDDDLTEVLESIAKLEEDQATLDAETEDAKQQFTSFDQLYADIGKEIEQALIHGNREDLQQEIAQKERMYEKVVSQISDAAKRHSELYRDMSLSRDLAATTLQSAFAKLSELKDEGKIPNSSIPVLEERLSSTICICGEQLQGGDHNATKRREHIAHLIQDSKRMDTLQGLATELYFGTLSLQIGGREGQGDWLGLCNEVVGQRDSLEVMKGDFEQQLGALEAKLARIPDTDLQGLRESRRQYGNQRDRFQRLMERKAADKRNVDRELETKNRQRDRLLSMQQKGQRIMADLAVAQDVLDVLERAYARLTSEELSKVSAELNDIFLEMIGADPQQGALIQGARISSEFDIVVYGPNSNLLNPDRDLNGASRRALTLAFILALTKVSEVEAPNVIDTPLGMMSGYVKRSVLNKASQESAQLVLFLTRSEIADCEDILDSQAGKVVTLTNPAHFPAMLLNDPGVEERMILTCNCTHREECDLCRRKTYAVA